ncbi:hypothetical protein FA95DRAFT_1610563 [Auriscalpium vulgare]|uniref:Uncharacterized protein n=1 Tax=Auriscalpium vulgare TaxID=40419 RepID=A0ACB8RDR3_9AGAM|nr:hypothetical protein FA95DRAFT_1610563 [Auriscalpium vulgare]
MSSSASSSAQPSTLSHNSLKRLRAESITSSENGNQGNSPSASKRARPDPYFTLPPPTTQYITLYIMLMRFKRVFRVVEVPLNYTFANLHTLMQFLFGWSGDHLHEVEVFDCVTLLKTRKGEIKEAGRIPAHQRELSDWYAVNGTGRIARQFKGSDPMWKVTTRKPRKNEWWDLEVENRLDAEATLGEVWNVDEKQNLSYRTEGDSSNEEIAIKYKYDLGSTWEVHISCNDDNTFVTKAVASNLPVIVKANGAPPLEDPPYPEPIEIDAHKKPIPRRFYEQDVFAKYCAHEMTCITREDKLDVCTDAEAKARHQEKRRRRKKKQRERKEIRDIPLSDDDLDTEDEQPAVREAEAGDDSTPPGESN